MKLLWRAIPYGVLVLLIAYSVRVRLPYINQPLGDKHEYVTSSVLVALETWQAEGPARHAFRIVQNYPGRENKHIWWVTTRLMSPDGDGYYLTYPPFSVILVYVIFRLLSISFTFPNLQAFNMATHGIGALFLYLLVSESARQNKVISGIMAAAIYLFLPLNLWLYSVVYSWDTLWHQFWIIEMFVFMLVLHRGEHSRKRQNTLIAILGILNFITIYTEYQGLVFTIGALAYVLINRKKLEYYKTVVTVLALSAAMAVIISFIQYASVSGIADFLSLMMRKTYDYGIYGYTGAFNPVVLVFDRYRWYYSPLFVPGLIVLACVLPWIIIRRQRPTAFPAAVVFFLMIFSILVHNVVFLNDLLTHEFGMLKFGVLVSFLWGWLISFVDVRKYLGKALVFITAIALYMVVRDSVILYKEISVFREHPEKYGQLASRISRFAVTGEPLFALTDIPILPQTVYLLKRNIQEVPNREAAVSWMRVNGFNKGILLRIRGYEVISADPLVL